MVAPFQLSAHTNASLGKEMKFWGTAVGVDAGPAGDRESGHAVPRRWGVNVTRKSLEMVLIPSLRQGHWGMNCPLRLDFSVIQVRDGLLLGESRNKEVTGFNGLSGSSYREQHYLIRKRGRGKRKIYFLCGKPMQKGLWVGQHYLWSGDISKQKEVCVGGVVERTTLLEDLVYLT